MKHLVTRVTILVSSLLALTTQAEVLGDSFGKNVNTLEPNKRQHFKRLDKGVDFTDQSWQLESFERLPSEGIAGAAWLDYDADGDLDLFIPNRSGAQNGFFENLGEGEFANITAEVGLDDVNGYNAVVAGDIDNDGYPDLYLVGTGGFRYTQTPSRMYRNNGDGTFSDISSMSNTPGSASNASASMVDVNNDGFLDLMITGKGLYHWTPPQIPTENTLYINNGDLTFTDVSVSAGINDETGSCVVVATDYNNDGWMDILVADCFGPNGVPTPFHLYQNNQDGTFTDVAQDVGLTALGFWMGLALGDYDNDGDLDIFATNAGILPFNLGVEPHILYRNNGNGSYTDVTPDGLGNLEFGWGATFGDWDNDGHVDLFFVGNWIEFGIFGTAIGNPSHMFFNDGEGNLVEDYQALDINLGSDQASGLARADYDGDGFMDLLIVREAFEMTTSITGETTASGTGRPLLFNNQGNRNHWVTIRPVGTQSNRMGIGAKLSLYTPSGRQLREVAAGSSFHSSETPWPTFGMGSWPGGKLKVEWPSGKKEFYRVKANRTLTIVEGSGKRIKP